MNFKTILGAIALIGGIATQSSASIVSVSKENYGATDANINFTSASTATFSWDSTPVNLSVDFKSDTAFSLSLLDYTGLARNDDVTGITLDLFAGLGGAALQRFSLDTDFCFTAVAEIAGKCNLIAQTGASGGNATNASKPGDVLFANLAAGTYRLGLKDSATPVSAEVSFGYSEVAPVPLPAGGLLLLSGLGVMALRRRRG